MRPKDPLKFPVKNQVKQTVRHPAKDPEYDGGFKRCPWLTGLHRIYIQTRRERWLHLTVGGHGYLLPQTSLVIKCPVRRFPKAYIRWQKNGRPLPSSKRLGVTKSGSLKIHFLEAGDVGTYKCIAGPASDIFTLQLIGGDHKLMERPSVESDSAAGLSPSRDFILPSCRSHRSQLELLGFVSLRVSLLPPGVQDASLQPPLEERLVNITLQVGMGIIKGEFHPNFRLLFL